MAGTVVSMAKSMLRGAISMAASAAATEMSLVMGVRKDIWARVEEVSNRNTRYNLITADASSSIDEVNSYTEDIHSHSASNIDEAELVGFAKAKQELIEMVDVNSRDGLCKVICVVGMGGLGKTTLARKAYESKEDTVSKFPCCAWITVSQSFSKIEILKDMIRQLLSSDSLMKCLEDLEGKAVEVEDLSKYLTKELVDKRYFVVLDDLWTIDACKWIQDIAFPSRNNKGSRIIVTTRDAGLAEQRTSDSLIYHLKPLQIEDATDLLLRKSRKTHEDMKNDKEMTTVLNKIVKKCGGLPLAVLTIGGMLSTKKVTEWESIYNQIPSELEVNPSLEAMRRIVTLSCNHLPSHLKSCFLYLSIFPEDFEIKRRRLIERWIAEGFVRATTRVRIEDVGKGYFDELVNRSMIQSSRRNVEGIVKSCHVHDIMCDVMVSISQHESLVYLAQDNVTSVTEETFRHRLLGPSPSVCSPDMRMLRALDLENAQFQVTQKDISNIGLFRQLKYLNFSDPQGYSHIYKLPRSIGKLQSLRILNIRDSYITELPTKICKLKSLHSLRCTRRSGYTYFDLNDRKKCLVNTLCLPMPFTPLFDTSDHTQKVAELHMAWSSRATKQKCKVLCDAIQKLLCLRSLEVDGSLEWLHVVSCPPPLLRSLKLDGCLGEIPGWVGNLTHLVKLYLWDSAIKEEGIIGVNQLPKLKEISLGPLGRVAKLALLQSEVGAHPNSPVLQLLWDQSDHDLGDVAVQVEEATEESSSLHPEPAARCEPSLKILVLIPKRPYASLVGAEAGEVKFSPI
nr:NBS-LRR disease resistance protein [Dasypyrum villosum]